MRAFTLPDTDQFNQTDYRNGDYLTVDLRHGTYTARVISAGGRYNRYALTLRSADEHTEPWDHAPAGARHATPAEVAEFEHARKTWRTRRGLAA